MDNPEPYWTRPRIAFWAILATIVVVGYGPRFVSAFQPPPGVYRDFAQEWLSARNYWINVPVYRPMHEAMADHTGRIIPPSAINWNAHPPVSVLIALPFGRIANYADAHLAWNLVTFPLFVLSIVLVLRELRVPFEVWSFLPTVSLTVISFPVLMNLLQGQLSFILALLLALGWMADRRGRSFWAGMALGLAAGIKLFPAYLFVYLLFAGRWRALSVGAAVMLGSNAAAMCIFGFDTFATYVREVLPSLEQFRNAWRNVSLTGFWMRALGMTDSVLAKMLSMASILAVTVVVSWRSWAARSVGERDLAFSSANLGMLLASPIAWMHYVVLLVVPVGVAWARLRSGCKRTFFLMTVPFLWLPEHLFALLLIERERADELLLLHHLSIGLADNLLVLSGFNYVLVVVFAIVASAPVSSEKPPPLNPYGASPIIPTEPTT